MPNLSQVETNVWSYEPKPRKQKDIGSESWWSWFLDLTQLKKYVYIWIYAFTEVMTAKASLFSIAVIFNQ